MSIHYFLNTEIFYSSSLNVHGIQKIVFVIKTYLIFETPLADVVCSKLYPSPYSRISCPYGYRTGSVCSFSCDPGKTLVGDTVVKCDESGTRMYGVWKWGNGQQSTCKGTSIIEMLHYLHCIRLYFIYIHVRYSE